MIRSETDFAFVLYRTQLFNPGDIENVKKIQAGYKVQPLSEFLGMPAPAASACGRFHQAAHGRTGAHVARNSSMC